MCISDHDYWIIVSFEVLPMLI